MLTERGTREMGSGLRDALARLRRRRAAVQEEMGRLEAELSDIGKVEAALATAIELLSRQGAAP